MRRPHRHDQAALDKAVHVFLDITVRWILSVLTELGSSRGQMEPLAALREALKQHAGQLTAALAAAGAASGAVAGTSIWLGSLGFFGSIGYWLGLVSLPLWAPVLGGLAGVVAGAGAGYAIAAGLQSRSTLDAAKLQLHVLSVLAWADGALDEQEHAALAGLQEQLIGAGVKAEKVAAILQQAPRSSESFALDAGKFPESRRRAALVDGWQLVLVSKGDREKAGQAFASLCRRLNLGAAATELQQTAAAMVGERGAQLGAALAAARFVGGELAPDALQRVLGTLTSMDPVQAAQRQSQTVQAAALSLSAAAAAVAAIATHNTRLLPIIGRAYAAAYGAVLERGGDAGSLRARAVQLGSELGVSADQTGAYVDELGATLSAQHAALSPQQTTSSPQQKTPSPQLQQTPESRNRDPS